MRKKIFIQIFLLVLAFLVTLATTYPKVEVTNRSDLENLSCGWPLKFVVHDDSLYDPPMPWKVPCGFLRGPYGQGTTKKFNWPYSQSSQFYPKIEKLTDFRLQLNQCNCYNM